MATFYSSYARSTRIYLTCTQGTQDIANNRTSVSWACGFSVGGSNEWYSNAAKIYSVYINGTKVWGGGTYSNIKGNGTYQKNSGSLWVGHNADGTKTFSVSFSGWFYSSYNVSGSGNMTLTTIPRTSTLTVNKTTVPADGVTTIAATATKASDSFTDTLTISLGDYSQTITSGTDFTIPTEWNNAMPDTTSATATVTVTTMNGSTTVGSNSQNVTITVPETAVPSISSLTLSEANQNIHQAFPGTYLKNYSQINGNVTAEGIYGSTIKEYLSTLNSISYTDAAFTTPAFATAGTYELETTVKDSRNRTASSKRTITIVDYELPELDDVSITRCDANGNFATDGSHTKVTMKGSVSSVNTLNDKILTLNYKKSGLENYTTKTLIPTTYNDFTVEAILDDIEYPGSYEYYVTLTDKLSGDEITIKTGQPTISRLAGGEGVTFFEEASEEGLYIGRNMPATFTGDIFIDDAELEALWNSWAGSTSTTE